MKHGFQKYIALFCAVIICALAVGTGLFTVAAMAAATTPGQTVQVESDASGSSAASSDSQKNSSAAASGAESSSSAESSGSEAEMSSSASSAESDLITVTFDLNGGTGMKTVAQLEKGTSVSQLKSPTKTGYRFTGWSRDGVMLAASKILDSDTTLTANWKKEESDEESTASVDTRQSQVDAAASAAKAAISDPDVLSSENWNSILSSSSAQSGTSSTVSSESVSSASAASGGFSTLLAAGIALILLGVGGIVLFIYLQFIRKPPRGGGPGGGHGANDDTMTFTDISSYSSGKKPDDASAVLYPQQPGPSASGETAPDADRQQTQEFRRYVRPRTAPDGAGNSDFDWEKFFESEDRGS